VYPAAITAALMSRSAAGWVDFDTTTAAVAAIIDNSV
jgi:hypothetical protein